VRTATLVLAAYVLCVLVGACWRLMPASLLRDAVPELGALTAAYLGLTARRGLAPAVGGSVAIGYLVDVISGAPAGLAALVLGVTCLVTRGAQQRILVRGAAMTIGFSAFVALVAGVVGLVVRAVAGIPLAAISVELWHLVLVAAATALIGPLVWRLFRRIDAAFARTHRERDAALEGLAP
jgi:cell shape-determining protein MreD